MGDRASAGIIVSGFVRPHPFVPDCFATNQPYLVPIAMMGARSLFQGAFIFSMFKEPSACG
jgi:hypothetical protein